MRWTVLILLLFGCSTMNAPVETGFLDRSVRVGSTTYPYSVYVPRNFDRSRSWPVVLSLHGAGERSTDGIRQTAIGVGNAIRFGPARIPAIVVFPQIPEETRWLGQEADAAMAALDEAIEEFNGDRDRVVLTGLSMGGYGTWHLAMAHPDRFAAIAPVCGGILPSRVTVAVQQSPLTKDGPDPYAVAAKKVRHLPIWVFHGADDPVIPVSESRRMVELLRAEGANVRYTEYEGVGHNAWDRAYGEEEFWKWLFAQRRR